MPEYQKRQVVGELPAGTNTIGSVKLTDGTNFALVTDEGILRIITLPTRTTSALGTGMLKFAHGVVTANYSIDTATAKTQGATLNLYITDVSIIVNTDLTAEIAVQEIPLLAHVFDSTDGVLLWEGLLSLPSNAHVSFNTPILVPKGHEWYTGLYLGGATNANLDVVLNGFESAD